MKVLAFIPARAGSKGIPGKNFKELAGRPLWEWSVLAAEDSKHVDRIVVSTDYDKPLQYEGPEPIFFHPRKPADATDEAQIEPAIIDCLEWLKSVDGYVPDLIALLQPTSPFRPPELIDLAIEWMEHTKADSLLTVHEGKGYRWMETKDIWIPDDYFIGNRQNRQQGGVEWRENGSLFLFKTSKFLEQENRMFSKVTGFSIGPKYGFEIDEPFDWQLMEWLMSNG